MTGASTAGAMEISGWRHELHELCQPLMRLQWRLEIGQRVGDEDALREAVEGGLEEARELAEHVNRMRELLARAQATTEMRR
jgi:signal transduction histidine kinase